MENGESGEWQVLACATLSMTPMSQTPRCPHHHLVNFSVVFEKMESDSTVSLAPLTMSQTFCCHKLFL